MDRKSVHSFFYSVSTMASSLLALLRRLALDQVSFNNFTNSPNIAVEVPESDLLDNAERLSLLSQTTRSVSEFYQFFEAAGFIFDRERNVFVLDLGRLAKQ
jgi:hypothetical protein